MRGSLFRALGGYGTDTTTGRSTGLLARRVCAAAGRLARAPDGRRDAELDCSRQLLDAGVRHVPRVAAINHLVRTGRRGQHPRLGPGEVPGHPLEPGGRGALA